MTGLAVLLTQLFGLGLVSIFFNLFSFPLRWSGPKVQAPPYAMSSDTEKRADSPHADPYLAASWNALQNLCQTRLISEGDKQAVNEFVSLTELVQLGKDAHENHKKTSKGPWYKRLVDVFKRLETFHGSFDILIHVEPAFAAPIWAMIKLWMKAVENSENYLQYTSVMFEEIMHTLPRVEAYVEYLGRCDELTEPRKDLYFLIAEFSCHVLNYCQIHHSHIGAADVWQSSRHGFEDIISRIRAKSQQIELTIHGLSLWKNARYHKKLEKMLTTPKIISRARLPCHCLPAFRNSTFVGREPELEAIHTYLSASTSQRTVSLHGLGGIGKTQVCLEYLSRHGESYDATFWISADTVIKLAEDAREALTKLGLFNEAAEKSDHRCILIFRSWLQETDAKWLLVFDNADDLNMLRNYWPKSRRGHILLSTRNPRSHQFLKNGEDMKGIHVPPLSESEGAQLLLNLVYWMKESLGYPRPTQTSKDVTFARDLVNTLDGLPLAISQFASYTNVGQCNMEGLWKLFHNFRNRKHFLNRDSEQLDVEYGHSLKTVWEISMSQVERANKESLHLLQLLALLDPNGVPESLLVGSDRQLDGSPASRPAYLEEIIYRNAKEELFQKSLITNDESNNILSMHRLVGEITQSKMTPEDRQARFDEALELLYPVYPQLELDKASLDNKWGKCRQYVSHIMSLEQCYRMSNPRPLPRAKFAIVLSNASWYLFEQGWPAQAMRILTTAQEVGEQTLAGQLPLATIYRTLGGIYLDANKPNEALDNFSKQLKALEQVGSPDDLVVAPGHTNVALAQIYMEYYENARKHLDKAQEIYSKHPDKAASFRSMTLDVIGLLEGLTGNHESSIKHLNEAIKLYNTDLGERNYLTAFAEFSLGNVYLKKDMLDEALKLHQSSLSVRREKLEKTYRTAASLHKVALILHKKGDHEGSREMLLEALDIYQNSSDEGKGGLARSSYLMSMVLSSMGHEEEAKEKKERAASIRKELLGTPLDQQDNLESYDQLIGALDR